jgi:hypothetical protein
MSHAQTSRQTPQQSRRLGVWLLVGAGLLVVGAANWHLVHVALTSQPACVDHTRSGESGGKAGAFSAAQSACTPN